MPFFRPRDIIVVFLLHHASTAADHRFIRSYGVVDSLLWPNGEVPYRIDPTYSEGAKKRIRAAMDIWEEHTCVRFVPYSGHAGGDLTILNMVGAGCKSVVGAGRGRSTKLEEAVCGAQATILHELGHALGLEHEQERPDRLPNKLPNAPGWHEPGENRRSDEYHQILTSTYDVFSIMHMNPWGRTKNLVWGRHSKSIDRFRTKDPCYQQFIGSGTKPSFYDVKGLNSAYKCDFRCNSTVISQCAEKGDECFVGGDCECLCPSMWWDPCRRSPDAPPKILPCDYRPYGNGWRCGNGRCIDKGYLCDGYADCDDGEDEICAGGRHYCPSCMENAFSSCKVDRAPKNVTLFSWSNGRPGLTLSCKEAVDKYPRYMCAHYVEARNQDCCMECFRRNITTGICKDQSDVCIGITHQDQCWGRPDLWDKCPSACELCGSYSHQCQGYSCKNGGSLNYYCDCICPEGFKGERCEHRVCSSGFCTECANNGTATVEGTCLCLSGFEGKRCQCTTRDTQRISVSARIGIERWRLISCFHVAKNYPNVACLTHSGQCCGVCDEGRAWCHDDADKCPSISSEDCHRMYERNLCPLKCGVCQEEACPGVDCLNGGTLMQDCKCRCSADWTGVLCEKDAYICEGADELDSSKCRNFTLPSNYESLCKSEKRFNCCASCREAATSALIGCVDDPGWCGSGKRFYSTWFCKNFLTRGEARKKCPQMCDWCGYR